MKPILKIVLSCVLLANTMVLAQVNPGATCSQAGCSASGSYTNLTGVASMGTYSCLGSTPNPNWLAIGIGTNGSVHLVLTQTTNSGSPIDVDFALYGPYTSVSSGCPIGPSTPTVDCSYSGSATEYVDIASATAGQVYILLVTNFNGQAGTISLQPNTTTPSTSTINCAINFTASTSMTPATCGQATGSVSVTPTSGYAPYTYSWNTPGNPTTQTVNNVAPGTYTVTILSSPNPTTGQTYNPTTATVTVTNINATYSTTSTLVSCPGGADGTATATMTPLIGNVTYLWSDGQTTQTATGLAAGTYTCTITSDSGCLGTSTVTVTEKPGMIVTIASQTDVSCNSGSNGSIEVSVTSGTPGYTYSWDNSSSITNYADDLPVGTHTATITDANGCVVSISGTLDEPDSLAIVSLTPDTQICPEDDLQLSVSGSGGSSPYIFTWYEDGTLLGTGTSMTVDPTVSNTQYCVVMSEACGSPEADSCMTITFPTPIIPNAVPDKLEDCTPGYFEFSNTSVNGGEIATTYFEFSDGTTRMETGTDSVSIIFVEPNFYSVDITVTSIFGCVYAGSVTNIVQVKPLPVADFTFSANPATFFETTIQMQDRSTADVIEWEWFSPGSTPNQSTVPNPKLVFPEGEVGEYPVTLYVTTDNGCTDSITQIMHVVPDVLFYAPNTFTPDGDEYNQDWGIFVSGIDIYYFDLFIFNKWGEVIWESHDKDATWDGTYNGVPVPQGTYTWRASAKDLLNDGKYEFQGYINVIR